MKHLATSWVSTWPHTCHILATFWQHPGHTLATPWWSYHGHTLATSLPHPANIMGTPCSHPGHTLATSWPYPSYIQAGTSPILKKIYPSQNLATSFPHHGNILATSPSGRILATPWPHLDHILDTLARYSPTSWPYPGHTLATSWAHLDHTQVTYWPHLLPHFGHILERHCLLSILLQFDNCKCDKWKIMWKNTCILVLLKFFFQECADSL